MTAREKLLTIARNEIGTKESPANSNDTQYGAWYGLNGQPWCMMFVQWCFYMAALSELLPVRTASCGELMRAVKKNLPARWHTSGYKPGDVVIFDFSGKKATTQHVGIVESVNAYGSVVTIEGNTSLTSNDNGGAVMRRTRQTRYIVGAFRPDYEGEDDMDIRKLDMTKLSEEQVGQLVNRLSKTQLLRLFDKMQAALSEQPAGAKLSEELQEAVNAGISDGSRPNAICTRIQAAVMVARAVNAMKE